MLKVMWSFTLTFYTNPRSIHVRFDLSVNTPEGTAGKGLDGCDFISLRIRRRRKREWERADPERKLTKKREK